MEVLKQKVDYKDDLKLSYEDLTERQGQELVLKNRRENEEKFGWWYYMQTSNLFMADKRKHGFMKQHREIDKIFLGEKTKLISKIYKSLLK